MKIHLVANLWILPVLTLCGACGSDAVPSNAGATGLGKNGLKLSGIGDSIMQGFNAGSCGRSLCLEQPEYSFAQGTNAEVRSLYLRFENPGEEFVSVSGAEMIGGASSAKSQATRICQQQVRPNRIVILLGGNDVCNSSSVASLPSVADFASALGDALGLLVSDPCDLDPGSAIHVVSVPRVDLLYDAGLAKSDVDCSSVWQRFGICSLVTAAPTKETLSAVAARIAGYNQAILDTVTMIESGIDPGRDLHVTTDYVGDTPDSSFGTYGFLPEDLSSLDCFHPSIEGQTKLACLSWESWQGGGATADCLK
jgi:hypothetical protein